MLIILSWRPKMGGGGYGTMPPLNTPLSRGQGQKCSWPRIQAQVFSEKRKVFKKFFSGDHPPKKDIISKLRHDAPTSILLKLYQYHAILHPHLLYGIIVWVSTYKSYLQKLVSLQNKGLRLITNNFTFHQPFLRVSLLYKQNKILKLSDIHTYEVAIFMHKFCNKKLPITFSKYFCKTDTVHKLRTRQNLACKFAIPRCNTSRLQRSIKYVGILELNFVWNQK